MMSSMSWISTEKVRKQVDFAGKGEESNESKVGFSLHDVLYHRKREEEFCGITKDEIEDRWVTTIGLSDVYHPPFCKMIHRIQSELSIDPFTSFAEMAFPRILPIDVANRFGLIESWPEILLSVQAFSGSDYERALDEIPRQFVLDPVQCALAYAWFALHGSNIGQLPIRIRESLGGWSFRNERREAIAPLKKGIEFLRDEYVCFGLGEQVRSTRIDLLKAFCHYLDKKDLEYRVVVGTGCFRSEDKLIADELRTIRNVCDVPVIDVEMLLPESGEWLEVLGATLWGTRITDAFQLQYKDSVLESGCVGLGISRLVYAILVQSGTSC